MRKPSFRLSFPVACLLAVTAYGQDPSAARKRLTALKIEFTEAAFLEQVWQGEADMVRLFLQAGMSPNTKAQYGQSVLQAAASTGRLEVVRLLVEAKADVNAADDSGGTALGSAALAAHPELIPLLVKAGADVSARDGDGNTVMHKFLQSASLEEWQQASAMPQMIRTLDALLSAKADVNAANRDGQTPLIMAAIGPITGLKTLPEQETLSLQLVKKLIQAGAAVDARDTEYQATALVFAASNGHVKMVSALIEAGADVNVKGHRGMTPLSAAKKHPEVQKVLQAAGAR